MRYKKSGKKVWIKVYNTSSNFLTTWQDAEISGFTWSMNGGFGELKVKLARGFFDFGEGGDVNLGNKIKVYISDYEANALQIYTGYISQYNQHLDGNNQYVEVTCLGYHTRLDDVVVESGSDTTITYSTKDPSEVIKDILDKVNVGITYSSTSMSATGTSITYQLIQNTAKEGINRMVENSPYGWYWYVDTDNVFNFKPKSGDTDHKLKVGINIANMNLVKSLERIKNRVFFLGGGSPQLYKKYERTTSETDYGIRDERKQDERVTVAGTATQQGTSILDNWDHPEIQLQATVVDSSIDSKNGYDIETFVPGQIVQIVNPDVAIYETKWDRATWDVDYWDYDVRNAFYQPMQIKEINYQFDRAVLKLGIVPSTLPEEINNNTKNLIDYRVKESPTAPS